MFAVTVLRPSVIRNEGGKGATVTRHSGEILFDCFTKPCMRVEENISDEVNAPFAHRE